MVNFYLGTLIIPKKLQPRIRPNEDDPNFEQLRQYENMGKYTNAMET